MTGTSAHPHAAGFNEVDLGGTGNQLENPAVSVGSTVPPQQRVVGFETLSLRLSTPQRPGNGGVPFFFVGTDRAGNLSKCQSAIACHSSGTGDSHPLRVIPEPAGQSAGHSSLSPDRDDHRGGDGSPCAAGLGESGFALSGTMPAERLGHAVGPFFEHPRLAANSSASS